MPKRHPHHRRSSRRAEAIARETFKVLSIDKDGDWESLPVWKPEDPEDVDFWLTIRIGPGPAGDWYGVRIVTPNNITGKDGGTHAIVLNRYSWEAVIEQIERIVADCPTEQLAAQEYLGHRFSWEYEDYKP